MILKKKGRYDRIIYCSNAKPVKDRLNPAGPMSTRPRTFLPILLLILCDASPLRAQTGNGTEEPSSGSAAPASADDKDAKEAAKKLFLEGVALFDKKDYEAALDKFLESYGLLPHWQIRFNIATCHFYLGKKAEALIELLEFLQEAGSEISPQQQKETKKYIDSIRAEIASVKFPGLEPGDEILVDGHPPKWSPREQELFLEPGSHHIMITRSGEILLDEDIPCTAGQEKEIRLYVKEKILAGPDKRAHKKKAGGKSAMVVAGWTLTGLAAALLVGGSVTGFLALNENKSIDDLENRYDSAPVSERPAIESEANDHYDKAMGLAHVSTALFAVGGAAAVAAIVTLVMGKKSEKRKSAKAKLSLGVLPSGISLNCSF
jgi:tetratricopeptide (TPR) repeat protein